MVTYDIAGVKVEFPFEAYPVQLMYMEKVRLGGAPYVPVMHLACALRPPLRRIARVGGARALQEAACVA